MKYCIRIGVICLIYPTFHIFLSYFHIYIYVSACVGEDWWHIYIYIYICLCVFMIARVYACACLWVCLGHLSLALRQNLKVTNSITRFYLRMCCNFGVKSSCSSPAETFLVFLLPVRKHSIPRPCWCCKILFTKSVLHITYARDFILDVHLSAYFQCAQNLEESHNNLFHTKILFTNGHI